MNDENNRQNVKVNNKKNHYVKKNNNSNLDWYFKNSYNKNKRVNKNNKNANTKKNNNVKKELIDDKLNIELIKKEVLNENNLPIKKAKTKNKTNNDIIVPIKKKNNEELIPIKKNDKEKNDIKKDKVITDSKKESIFSKLKKDKNKQKEDIPFKNSKIKNEKEIEEKEEIKKQEKNVNNKNRTIYGRRIPLNVGEEFDKIRRKIIVRETLIIALMFAILNLVAYFIVDNVMIIALTNKTYLNLIITFVINFVIIMIVTYIVDYLITKFIVIRKNKINIKEGDYHRSSGFIKGKNKKDI